MHSIHQNLRLDEKNEAIRALGEITGEELTEAVLDRVFSRFCIGK